MPGLGVHPWRTHELRDGWFRRLAALVALHPAALVGEIGLCKCAKNLRGSGMKKRNWPMQIEAFAQQLHLAAVLFRPVSVHCVHAQHTLLNCLRQAPRLPPSIGLHSFSGTAHDVKQLLALPSCGERLYFGFSHTVNVAMGGGPGTDGHNSLLAAIRAVPTNRLLVESDVDDPSVAATATLSAAHLIATALGKSVEEAAALTSENGRNFLCAAQKGQRRRSGAVGLRVEALPGGRGVRVAVAVT